MTKNERINLRLKYNRFLKYKPFFSFNPSINNREDLQEYYDKEIQVTHLKCGKIMNIKLSEWMNLHSTNRGVSKEGYMYLCNHCSQEEKNRSFQEKLDKNHNKDFILISNYEGKKKPVLIKHMTCGQEFSIIPEYNKSDGLICRGCGKTSEYYENKIKEEKDLEFKKELKEKGFENFIPLEQYTSRTTIMKFKHTHCGNVFEKTPQSIFKLKNKDICPKCTDNFKNACSQSQDDKNKYFQGRLDRLYDKKFVLIGDYKGVNSKVKIKHLKCGDEYFKYSQTLLKGNYKCYCQKSQTTKNNEFITLSEKIKIYENILNNKYKILTPFINESDNIKIKHLDCGHEFERTVITYVRSKGRILCPICNKKARFEKLKEKIYEKYGDEYVITDGIEYSDYKGDIEVFHKKCGKKFVSNFNVLLSRAKDHCVHCNPRITSDKAFRQAVFNKFRGEYLVLTPYINSKTEIYFRHKKCGKKFKLTSREFLNYITPCPDCKKKRKSFSINQAQERVSAKFGNLFTLCGIYVNMHTTLPIRCNACGGVIEYTVNNILRKKGCPCCNSTYL